MKTMNEVMRFALKMVKKPVMAYFKSYEKLYAEIGDNMKYIRCTL